MRSVVAFIFNRFCFEWRFRVKDLSVGVEGVSTRLKDSFCVYVVTFGVFGVILGLSRGDLYLLTYGFLELLKGDL